MATGFETLLFNGNIHPNLKNLFVEVESEHDRKKGDKLQISVFFSDLKTLLLSQDCFFWKLSHTYTCTYLWIQSRTLQRLLNSPQGQFKLMWTKVYASSSAGTPAGQASVRWCHYKLLQLNQLIHHCSVSWEMSRNVVLWDGLKIADLSHLLF